MADEKKRTAAAAGVGITAGAILALLASRKIRAAAAEMIVGLDDPAMQALLGLLANAEALGIDTSQIINQLGNVTDAINNLATALGVTVPTFQNPPDITAFTVFTTALTIPRQLPYREVPYDKELVVKALHTNLGVILVAPNQASAININSSYWLIANEAIEYKIRNADHIWISCHPVLGVVGDGVVCTVEQEATH